MSEYEYKSVCFSALFFTNESLEDELQSLLDEYAADGGDCILCNFPDRWHLYVFAFLKEKNN